MTNEPVKASVNPAVRTKAVISIALYAILALFSTFMAIFDFATGRTFFGVLFLLAVAIFTVLLLIKGNMVFGTYLKISDNTLCLKSWDNDFLPYDVNGGFFSDLKPSKTKMSKIPAEDISLILIGTKDFIKRNITESGKGFIKALFPYEHSSKKSKRNMISAIDLFYVETVDGDCSFMCVEGYNPRDVVKVIGTLYDTNPSMHIKVNSREYKKHIMKLKNAE